LPKQPLKIKSHTCPTFATTFPAVSAFPDTTFFGTKLGAFSGTTGKALPLTTAEHRNFKNVRIARDDDDFGGVRVEKVLAGRRRVKDVFDVSE